MKIKIITIISLLATSLAFADNRVALVIGNSNYQYLQPLDGYPINDANDVATTLTHLGFAVTLKTDLDFSQMRREIIRFRKNHITPKTELALLYYAGHGTEYEHQNYLLPTNIRLAHCEQLEADAMGVDFVLDNLTKGRAKTTVIVFDACRNLPSACQRSGENSLSRQQYNYPNTLVAYSTRSGDNAGNSSGRNSPYTTALLKLLNTPNLSLFSVFNGIKMPAQQPTLSISGNINDVVLNPLKTQDEATNDAVTAGEKAIIDSLQKTTYYLQKNVIQTPAPWLSYGKAECLNNERYNEIVYALVRLHAYYYFFREDLNGYYPFASYDGKASRGKNAGHKMEAIDDLMRDISISMLKKMMSTATKFLSPKEKHALLTFSEYAEKAYHIFLEQMTAEKSTWLSQKINMGYGLTRDDFYTMGFPKTAACHDKVLYTGEIAGVSIFTGNGNSTSFMYDSLDFYLYSFWLRRYQAGTISQAKALLDYAKATL